MDGSRVETELGLVLVVALLEVDVSCSGEPVEAADPAGRREGALDVVGPAKRRVADALVKLQAIALDGLQGAVSRTTVLIPLSQKIPT